ncbi:MAG TPA: hypothetical protein VFV69_23210 [Steroidobacteraceae bacterium]|jgi:hypothetical protein|nr:hypothetical protein [Steroidobacteraceae bacterium]
MTTQAATTVGLASRSNLTERLFFAGMALAMIVTVFVGFAPTYYVTRSAARPLTPLLHAHGALATAWMLLFLAQTALVAAHRVHIHRRLGLAGVIVATALAIFTMAASIVSRGFTPRLTFSAGAVLMFGIYVVAGFLQRREPAGHKRLMLLATIALLPPAISRMDVPFMPHNSFGPNFVGLFFLIPAFVYDLTTRGKIHPALLWGGLFMIVMLPLRLLLKNYVF